MKTQTPTATDERIDEPSTSQHKHDKHQGGCKHKGQHKKAEHKDKSKKAEHKGNCGGGKGQHKHSKQSDPQEA